MISTTDSLSATQWLQSPIVLDRITRNSGVLAGKPCIRGMRVSVETIVGLLSEGCSVDSVLDAYPYLEREDLVQAQVYEESENCGF